MTTAEYSALTSKIDWSSQDRFGIVITGLDPFLMLREAEAPAVVIAAFVLAKESGCDVKFEVHSSHVGGFDHVVAVGVKGVGVKDPSVRAAFDAIDRSGLRDESYRSSRWEEGKHRADETECWAWTTDMS